jgi:hypothetical protein
MANEIESTFWVEEDVGGLPTNAEEVKTSLVQAQTWEEVEEALNYHTGSISITTHGWDNQNVRLSYLRLWSEYVQVEQNPRTPS